MMTPVEIFRLRDEFAMAALTGMCANETEDWNPGTHAERARQAFLLADAMMEARTPKAR